MLKKLKNKQGLTLVELIIALTIFSILMVAFLSLFMTSMKITIKAGDKDATVADVSGKLENDIGDRAYDATKESLAIINFSGGTRNMITTKTTENGTTKDGTNVELDAYIPYVPTTP